MTAARNSQSIRTPRRLLSHLSQLLKTLALPSKSYCFGRGQPGLFQFLITQFIKFRTLGTGHMSTQATAPAAATSSTKLVAATRKSRFKNFDSFLVLLPSLIAIII